ncbi:hypothetical protein [Amphritea pacifica]|uniref:hypothetical protein n=1 Tax=Amphritea pacifica TaxID=2811233 RepID=UPI0019640B79|nr:hypothetical protein [Amphritea pacifica]MBN1006600.1 hypothetical protein [Amphritea pacifica]
MSGHSVQISKADIAYAKGLVEKAKETGDTSHLSEMYEYMADKGDRYAELANGVVEGDTLSGKSALEFMEHTATSQGIEWDEGKTDSIRMEVKGTDLFIHRMSE